MRVVLIVTEFPSYNLDRRRRTGTGQQR